MGAAAAGGHGAIAQLEERLDRTQEVAGSSPASSTAEKPRYGEVSWLGTPPTPFLSGGLGSDLEAVVPLSGSDRCSGGPV